MHSLQSPHDRFFIPTTGALAVADAGRNTDFFAYQPVCRHSDIQCDSSIIGRQAQPPDQRNGDRHVEGEAALGRAILAARARGAAVIIVAHRTGVLQAADRLLVLREGAIEPLDKSGRLYRVLDETRLQPAAGIAPERVGVKATTNETMGFIGRGEGIAAMAVVQVEPS